MYFNITKKHRSVYETSELSMQVFDMKPQELAEEGEGKAGRGRERMRHGQRARERERERARKSSRSV